MRRLALALSAVFSVSSGVAQSAVNFESGPVTPMRVSADGTRLFVADRIGGRVNVFDLRDPSQPFLIAEIPVGLEPVSVNPRTRDEVWVVNLLSDSVDVVSVPERRVVATIRVVDEPSDVVFAGGKAFVSAATTDEVEVFDVATRAPLGTVALFGKDPRSLAVSPDGTRVYAVIQRSGNGTTILPAGTQAPPAAGPGLPAAPAQGIIVRADDPTWAANIPYTLPDNDVAQIDVATLTVTRYFKAVGTTNTGIAVHPTSGDLWVANTEARNLVRFEPNLRGHAIDSRVTKITTGANPGITPFDLNPGVNYAVLPNPAALATALAEPFGVAIDGTTNRVYVAAHGTDRVGVLDLSGNVLARIEIGVTPGTTVNPRQKRGPRGVALHPSAARLYVLNHLSDTLSVVDTSTNAVLNERPLATVDPLPQAQREGRKFLYDAKLSGNGTMSCAACHVDGDLDGVAWDLGDPNGTLALPIFQATVFFPLLEPLHPMKGPMTTQTLRGLAGTAPLHWRGDRADFQAFNGAFDTLLGGSLLATPDMDDFAAFVDTMVHPPNPNQQLDRARRTLPANNNEAAGLAAFEQNLAPPGMGTLSCTACHTLPFGTDGTVVNRQTIGFPQQMKVAHLRNLYRKVGFSLTAAPQKIGFGFLHDGSIADLTSFLQLPQLAGWPAATKDDLETFLLAFDTGTAPAVGYQFVVSQANANDPAMHAEFVLVTSRAAAGELDVTAHGRLDGRVTSLLYEPSTGLFLGDRTGEGPFSVTDLYTKAVAGDLDVVFTAVPYGAGQRVARDRDLDGTNDGDEAASFHGVATAGCAGESRLLVNSEPRQGNAQFGLVVENGPPSSIGIHALALAPASIPVIGITLLVDPGSLVLLLAIGDGSGSATLAWPVTPAEPPGLQIFAQTLWLDPCGSQGWSSTGGLSFTFRP